MNWELFWVLALLGAAVVMFVINRPGMDVVGLLMIAALPFTGVLTVSEALAGFSDSNIVLIAFLFVLGEGLVRTGVANRLGDLIHHRAGGKELRLLILLMIAVAGLGAVMSSTAVVAIFIPVVFRICRSSGVSPGRLMMPVSFAALISGMLTLISTAPNLVVNAELVRQGGTSFGFFSVTPFGLVVLVVGLAYMMIARRWIPDRVEPNMDAKRRPTFRDWIARYHLGNREHRVRVMAGSPIIGHPLADLAHLLRESGVNLLAVERTVNRKRTLFRPTSSYLPEAGDVVLMDIREPRRSGEELISDLGVERLELSPDSGYLTDFSQELGMSEAIIPPDSQLVGKTVCESRLRTSAGLTVIGLRRRGSTVIPDFMNEALQVGDTVLVTGFWKDIQRVQQDTGELVMLDLPEEAEQVLPAGNKAPLAVGILILVVGIMVFGILPNVQAVLLGCLLMGACGILSMRSAYGSISWKSLVLIVGMMPFSLALQRTGGVDMAADAMMSLIGDGSPRLALAAIFVVTAVLGLFISNTATAVLMAPVAFAIAAEMGASPYPFAMVVMLAASAAFMTPVSSPVNTLVVAPGNYQFGDFVRIGVPFTIIVLIIAVIMVPWLLPV